MPTIQNVRLEIVENQGAAAALVTYRLAFNSQDLGHPLNYVETVELIGVDPLPREDGQDDPIPGGRVDNAVTFSPNAAEGRRLIALQGTSLNEDKDATGPIAIAVQPDEIRARVTLSPHPGASISAVSDPPLVLHALVNSTSSLSPA